jgi:hypothetical protein
MVNIFSSLDGVIASLVVHLIAALEPLKNRGHEALNADDELVAITCFSFFSLSLQSECLHDNSKSKSSSSLQTSSNNPSNASMLEKSKKDPYRGPFLAQLVQSLLYFCHHR